MLTMNPNNETDYQNPESQDDFSGSQAPNNGLEEMHSAFEGTTVTEEAHDTDNPPAEDTQTTDVFTEDESAVQKAIEPSEDLVAEPTVQPEVTEAPTPEAAAPEDLQESAAEPEQTAPTEDEESSVIVVRAEKKSEPESQPEPVVSPAPESRPEEPTPKPVLQPQEQSSVTEVSVASGAAAASAASKGNKKFLVTIIMLVLFAIGAVAAVYLWQSKEVQSLSSENTSLTEQLKAANAVGESDQNTQQTTPAGTIPRSEAKQDYVLVPGTVTVGDNGDTTLLPYMKVGMGVEEIWLEYGTSPTALTEQTERQSKEIGMGDPNTYVAKTFVLKSSELTPGTNYYYRVAGKVGSAVVYSGVAGFTSAK